ncbi:MAG: hypothetical protein FWD15_02170 [Alphaproteobacteria bacterium]|nr:hypothetical protein [Alphaproteobacteria bacterium]
MKKELSFEIVYCGKTYVVSGDIFKLSIEEIKSRALEGVSMDSGNKITVVDDNNGAYYEGNSDKTIRGVERVVISANVGEIKSDCKGCTECVDRLKNIRPPFFTGCRNKNIAKLNKNITALITSIRQKKR